jgi:hypothetical protein
MFPAILGGTTAVWLLLAPGLGLQSGPRSAVAVFVGVAALALAPLANWRRAPRALLAALGLALALVNFALPGSAGALADFATCAVALIIAGLAPAPEVLPRAALVAPVIAQQPAFDESETPTRRLLRAA